MVTGGAQNLELQPELVDDKNFNVTREMLLTINKNLIFLSSVKMIKTKKH